MKILLFGNYGGINLGDEAILQGLLTAIDRQKCEITVVSADPAQTKATHKVQAVYPPPFGLRSLWRGTFWTTVQAIRTADIILFGGGGLFQDHERGALPMWSWFLRLCFFFNKRVAVVANSCGPFAITERQKRLFARVSFFSVRDHASMNFLRHLGIPPTKITLATDAAFFLPAKRARKRRGVVLVLHGKNLEPKPLQEIKKFVQVLQKRRVPITLLPMQKRITADHKLAEKLDIPCLAPQGVDEAYSALASAKFVLTGRFHGAVLAILGGTPFLAFSPLPKVRDFLSGLGVGDFPERANAHGGKRKMLSNFFAHKGLTAKIALNAYKAATTNGAAISRELTALARAEKKKTKAILPDFLGK